jgi:GWxTD domain-containing protein
MMGLVALAALALAPGVGAGAHEPRDDVEALYRAALRNIARNTVDSRRSAMLELERATLLSPERADFHMELGRLYYRMGFLKQARLRFERVASLDSNRPEAAIGLGDVWRRDYLKYLERSSLGRALEHYERASRLVPDRAEPWLKQAPLQLERGDSLAAMRSAERALAAEPDRVDALLAVAQHCYRTGRVERADSAFRAVLPRLPVQARERFDDIAPVATEADTARLRRLPDSEKPEFLRRFWRDNDPDPVTPENEAQLEYLSRVAQAYFLFFDPKRREWDERGEFYVRYGPPGSADYNPVGMRLSYSFTTGSPYPLNLLVWHYPGLGMSVTMEDRLLSEFYLAPITRRPPEGREPDPAVLGGRDDVWTTRDGRGVFPILPPGVGRRPADGLVARFEGETGGVHLLGFVATPGEPADTLHAEWVLIDSARVERVRISRTLDPSPCDPGRHRVADFASLVTPGEYVAGLSVRDARGRRGVVRRSVRIEAPRSAISLSDIVVSCGAPQVRGGEPGVPPSVRLSANVAARVGPAEPLTVYFETYHLQPGRDGRSRFEYEYTVQSAEKDPRVWIQRVFNPRPELPQVSAIRREEQAATLRRQFVSVPVQNLPDGRYRLEIRVRDLVSGGESRGSVDFAKGPALSPPEAPG